MASLKRIICALAAAFALWAAMFSPLTAPHLPFWPMMTLAAVVLTCFATLGAPAWWKRVRLTPANAALGVAIAAGLWIAFWVGDAVSSRLFSFAHPEVHAIYGIKEGVSPWGLSLLLMLLIGPAEEIFWRGFVQEQIARRWNANIALVVATGLYTAVHVPSCNFMLVAASLVAGATWGLCYRLFPGRLAAIIISHSLWDAAVFIWFPIQ